MASVEILDVRKSFGSTEVLHGVDIDIPDRGFVVLVGPSGCGKSTLLRMIAGLEEITSGEIRIGERTVNRLPPKQRDVAMVFQNYALYPHMKVFDNMAFSLKLAKVEPAEMTARVQRAAEVLDHERYTSEGPIALGSSRLSPRRLVARVDYRVDLRIDSLDPCNGLLDQLEWRCFARFYQPCLCGGIKYCVHWFPFLRPTLWRPSARTW